MDFHPKTINISAIYYPLSTQISYRNQFWVKTDGENLDGQSTIERTMLLNHKQPLR